MIPLCPSARRRVRMFVHLEVESLLCTQCARPRIWHWNTGSTFLGHASKPALCSESCLIGCGGIRLRVAQSVRQHDCIARCCAWSLGAKQGRKAEGHKSDSAHLRCWRFGDWNVRCNEFSGRYLLLPGRIGFDDAIITTGGCSLSWPDNRALVKQAEATLFSPTANAWLSADGGTLFVSGSEILRFRRAL